MKTKICFRKFPENDIVALFPDTVDENNMCDSYMHVGQHARASFDPAMKFTVAAEPHEYEALKKELEMVGYDIDVQ